jgi:hypothetical protein
MRNQQIERLARFLHKREEERMDREEYRSIPSFDERKDGWIEQAKAILDFIDSPPGSQ